jgi:hypothetical protein
MYYVRIGNDYLEQAIPFKTKSAAVDYYRAVAEDLDRFGQAISATVHVAPDRDMVNEYPDWVLSLGPKGGLRVECA